MRKVPLVMVVCGLMFLVGTQSLAADRETDALIEQASARYADLDFEGAIRLLDQAFKKVENSRFQLVRIYHLKGLCVGSLGQYDLAREAFKQLLSLDPSFRLGADVSPRVRSPFEDLLKTNPPRMEIQLLPPPFAQLEKPVVMNVRVVADPFKLARSVRVWFRQGAKGTFSSMRVALGGGGEFPVTIAAPVWHTTKGLEPLSWFAVIENEYEGHLQDIGEESRPLSLEVLEKPPKQGTTVVVKETPWYGRWWVWALVGGAVAAGTTTAVLLATKTPSGPFDFIVDIK